MKRKLVPFGAGAALLLACFAGATGTAHAVAVPPGGGGCVWHAYGSPGTDSFTLHVDTNTCGLQIRAYARCSLGPYPLGSFGSRIEEGNTITGTGSSKVSCAIVDGGYGYQWAPQGSSAWNSVQLGDVNR